MATNPQKRKVDGNMNKDAFAEATEYGKEILAGLDFGKVERILSIQERIDLLKHQVSRNWQDYEDCQDTVNSIVRKIDELEEQIEGLRDGRV